MNLNPIEFNYQDGLNTYPIIDYIDDKFNSIVIPEINFIDSSNIFINGSSLSNFIYTSNDNNYTHLYIQNSNVFGEIRFSSALNYPDNTNINYGAKIDFAGRLFVYHNFNPIQPTFPAGWYDVEGELLAIKNDGLATDIQLSLLEGVVWGASN